MTPMHDGDPVVTLDVLHSGVIWGWYVTMNMWAKSVGTGVVLVGAFMLRRHGQSAFYRKWMPILGFLFVQLTLLFTVLDLHQMFRFWHLFVWPHWNSAIPVGAWLLTIYTGLLAAMGLAWFKHRDDWFERLMTPTVVVAFFSTIYTAALMGQANARELWQTPAEIAQTLLAAALAGSAAFLVVGEPGAPQRMSLAWILGLSAMLAATIFASELIFAPQKSEEAAYVIHEILLKGSVGTLFMAGMALGFGVPMVAAVWSVKRGEPVWLKTAAVCGLCGLWMVKHAWLLAPQFLPLS